MKASKWRALALAVFVVACGGDDDDGSSSDNDNNDNNDNNDEPGDIDAGQPPSACLTPALSCPQSAPTIGTAGGYKLDSFAIDWTYCAEEDVSVGTPVYFTVPADI